MITIGIDPGQTGAIAVLRRQKDGEEVILDLFDMPRVEGKRGGVSSPALKIEIERWCTSVTNPLFTPYRIVIEAVHSMPDDGHKGAFRFGDNYGLLRGTLGGMGVPYRLVEPSVWKRRAGLIRKDKSASRLLASEMFPEKVDMFKRQKDHGRAEAALIAVFGLS